MREPAAWNLDRARSMWELINDAGLTLQIDKSDAICQRDIPGGCYYTKKKNVYFARRNYAPKENSHYSRRRTIKPRLDYEFLPHANVNYVKTRLIRSGRNEESHSRIVRVEVSSRSLLPPRFAFIQCVRRS